MKKVLQWVGIGTLAVFLICGIFVFIGYNQAQRLKPSMDSFISGFYAVMDSGDYHRIYEGMTAPEFRKFSDYGHFEKVARGISEKLGKVTQRKESYWRINQTPGGLYFAVQYGTTREKGKATESFTLKRDGDSWKLISYNVNSADFF